jgi:hypothetical protein
MTPIRWLAAFAAASTLALPTLPVHADPVALRARHTDLRAALRDNNYQRALHIESIEKSDELQGDVHAVLNHPFDKVSQALREPDAWCDIMILPFNTKYCHALEQPGNEQLLVRIGRKYNQPVDQAFKLNFALRNQATRSDYFETRLTAPEGPLGTRDYRIRVSAIPLDAGRTFLHLSYTYGYGMAGRLAMQAYLATIGADKVGFSMSGKDANGQPMLTGGVRGAVERNAMRYYLAIDAYLETLDTVASQRTEKRIQAWFNATERYPKQMREMDRTTYVTMKRQEYERQQTALN